jgi:hypothetical protein
VQAVLFEQDLPLVNSANAATAVTMNVSLIESNGKTDFIHTNGTAPAADSNGLGPNPSNSAAVTGTGPDGYGTTGASHEELMTPSWITNGAAEGYLITLNGLTPNGMFNLYVYGAGSANGQGGTFTLTDSSGVATGGGSVTTNSGSTTLYKSVFEADGTTLVTAGESWNKIAAVADNTGSLSFEELFSVSGTKPAINGFQIDAVPEPASLGLLALGGLGLLGRRRPKAE